jgi:hypothetical protein
MTVLEVNKQSGTYLLGALYTLPNSGLAHWLEWVHFSLSPHGWHIASLHFV